MEEGRCGGGRDVLTESADQRGTVVGVHRKRCHELACVLTHLGEWIKCGWLSCGSRLALGASFAPMAATQGATAANAVVLEHYGTRRSPPDMHHVREQVQTHAWRGRGG